jgi:hypothetical protein
VPLPELAISADTLALGFQPSLVGRIAAVLLRRYRSDEFLASYFNELEVVASEALEALAEGGSAAPVAYLAFNDVEETLIGGGFSEVVSTWKILVKLPMPAQLKGLDVLEKREGITDRFKALTFGLENPGVIENDDNPGSPLAYRLAKWARVDATQVTPGNATLRSLIGFSFESKIHTITREVY